MLKNVKANASSQQYPRFVSKLFNIFTRLAFAVRPPRSVPDAIFDSCPGLGVIVFIFLASGGTEC